MRSIVSEKESPNSSTYHGSLRPEVGWQTVPERGSSPVSSSRVDCSPRLSCGEGAG